MENTQTQLESLRKGVGFVSHAITLLIVALLVAAAGMFGAYALSSMSVMGALMTLAGLLMIGSALLGLAGKYYCLKSPVAAQMVQISLAIDVLCFLGAFVSRSGGGLLGLVSTGLFMGFLYKLALYLEDGELANQLMSTVKTYGYGFASFVVGAVAVFVTPLGGAIFSLVGLGMFLMAFFSYLRCLTLTQQALAYAGTRGPSERPTSSGF